MRDQFVTLWPAIAALCVSHGVSFFINFLGRREYVGRNLEDQMTEPYRRIIVMHVTIIVGGILAMALKTPLPALILLIALKIGVDLRAHLGERKPVKIST